MPEEGANSVEFPDVLYDLWQWFLRLNATRPSGMAPSPISESEIRAFCLNRQMHLELWQLNAIRLLDAVALESTKEQA